MSRKAIKFQDLREDQWLKDFRRALGYIWPQKKYLTLSILLIALGAASYSASLSLVLPILKVMAEPEGLHGWAYRLVTEDRTGLRFDTYDSQRYQPILGAPEFSLLVREVDDDSPLGQTELADLGTEPPKNRRRHDLVDEVLSKLIYHTAAQNDSSEIEQ